MYYIRTSWGDRMGQLISTGLQSWQVECQHAIVVQCDGKPCWKMRLPTSCS